MSMLRTAGKATSKAFKGAAKARKFNREMWDKVVRGATKPNTCGQKLKKSFKSPFRNIVIPGLAGYGVARGMQDLGLIKKPKKKKESTTKKYKTNREKWAAEESYIPQTQRRAMGGQVYNKGRKVPGMYNDL